MAVTRSSILLIVSKMASLVCSIFILFYFLGANKFSRCFLPLSTNECSDEKGQVDFHLFILVYLLLNFGYCFLCNTFFERENSCLNLFDYEKNIFLFSGRLHFTRTERAWEIFSEMCCSPEYWSSCCSLLIIQRTLHLVHIHTLSHSIGASRERSW